MQFILLTVLLAACCVKAQTLGPGDHQPSSRSGTVVTLDPPTISSLPTPTDSLGGDTIALTATGPTSAPAFTPKTSVPPLPTATDSWTTISTLLSPADTSRSAPTHAPTDAPTDVSALTSSTSAKPRGPTGTDTALLPTAPTSRSISHALTATTTEKIPAATVTAPAVPVAQKWYNNPWFHVVVTAVLTLALFTWPLILVGMWVQRRRIRRRDAGRTGGVNSISLENMGTAV